MTALRRDARRSSSCAHAFATSRPRRSFDSARSTRKARSPRPISFGPRARLSRADHDDEAIERYDDVIARFGKSPDAAAATFFAARLELLHGRWEKAAHASTTTSRSIAGGADHDEAMHLRAIAHFEKRRRRQDDARATRATRGVGARRHRARADGEPRGARRVERRRSHARHRALHGRREVASAHVARARRARAARRSSARRPAGDSRAPRIKRQTPLS